MRDHAAALIELLKTIPNLGVHDGKAPPKTSGRYVVITLTTPSGARASRRLSADEPKANYLLSTMAVGDTPNECRWVVEHVQDLLIGARLVVAGRACSKFLPPRSGDNVRPDDSIQPPAWVATDVWPFSSTPTA